MVARIVTKLVKGINTAARRSREIVKLTPAKIREQNARKGRVMFISIAIAICTIISLDG